MKNSNVYINDAAEALKSSSVYVDPDANFSGLGQGVPTDFAVVGLPSSVTQDQQPSFYADSLKASTNYNVVFVVTDEGQFAVAPSGTPAAKAAYEAFFGNDGPVSPVSGVTAAADAYLKASTSTGTSTGTPPLTPENNSGSSMMVVGGVILGLAVAFAMVAIFARQFFIKKNSAKMITYDRLPEELKKTLEQFRNIVEKHAVVGAPAMNVHLRNILMNVQELFRRLDKRGETQQKRLAEVSYRDTLEKLNRALGEDYYLDILAHPNLWEGSQARLAEVVEAVAATDQQVVQNIRQVNASQDLELKVALDSLTRSMDAPRVEELYRNEDNHEELL